MFILFLLTSRFGFCTIDSTYDIYLLKHHFPKEIFSTITLYLIPLQIIFSFLGSLISKKKKEFTIYLCLYFIY